jgi:hypothetical protein
MNPFKGGELAATIAESVAPETTKMAEAAVQRFLGETSGAVASASAEAKPALNTLGGEIIESDIVSPGRVLFGSSNFRGRTGDFRVITVSGQAPEKVLPSEEFHALWNAAGDASGAVPPVYSSLRTAAERLHSSQLQDSWTNADWARMYRILGKSES